MICILGEGEDNSDDHNEAEMGGEPCPIGRANLFDTRKILWHSGRREEKEYVFLSCAGEKEKMRACQCTVVHREK